MVGRPGPRTWAHRRVQFQRAGSGSALRVAIINAETIRNPFSQDRQRLCSLIECHGSVEFLQDEFTDEVERTTSVEIALIYLEKIPGQYLDVDALMGNLKRGDTFCRTCSIHR